MRFWVVLNPKSRAEQPVLLQVARQRSWCRQARQARQLSPVTGQHSVSILPTLA
ncbi:hypothetical protein A2U01_0074898, partial [Trifolium medium]|nr:hypothetical protein [Trifolium medium]